MDTVKAQKASELLIKKKVIESEISDIEKVLLVDNNIIRMMWVCHNVRDITLDRNNKHIPEAHEFMKSILSHLLLTYKAKLSEVNIEIMSL
jgi:hypothetical protein